MKLSKSVFKSIVKECLIEILSEGVGGQLKESLAVPQQKLRENKVVQQKSQQSQHTQLLKNAIKESAAGNPIMEQIFADTAVHTLPSMMESGQRHSDDRRVSSDDVISKSDDLDEGISSNWADLAFSTPKNMSNSFLPPPPPPAVRKLSDKELDTPVLNKK